MPRHTPNDETLMARFKDAFDEDAFREVVARHHRAAQAYAVALLGDAAAAEDAVQEAFVRVVRCRRKYDPRRAFSPWFYRLLRNACMDSLRRRKGRERKHRAYAEEAASPTQAETANRQWLLSLQALRHRDREVLVLRFVQGYSFREIARHVGCSEAAAKKRGQRALKRLRRLLDSSPLMTPQDCPREPAEQSPPLGVRPLPSTR